MLRSILCLSAACLIPGIAAAEVLTLEQAISIALENNRTLKSSALSIEKSREQLAALRAKQFPGINVYVLGAQQLRSFDFTLEQGVLGQYQGTGPLPSQDVHLKTPLEPTGLVTARVVQPLTSLVRIRRNMDTLKTAVQLAEEETRGERQKTVRDIKRAYYGLQQVEASLRSVRETTVLYKEVAQLTSNYVIQEVALRGDLLQAQISLAKAQQLELSLVNQRSAGKEQLNHLLGRDVLLEFDVQPVWEASDEAASLELARANALRDRPEIRKSALREVQAAQDLKAKRAEYIPDVSAEFNNVSFLNWGRFMPTQSTSVGVSLSWEPFDWGRKKHEIREKQGTVNQARMAKAEAESSVLADVNDKYRQLQYNRAEVNVARLSQNMAVENLRVAKNKYAVEAVLVKDVLQAQVNLEHSNSDYQQALTSFRNARADFERSLGEDQ